jgi:KUP system potassium uptake protein
VEKTRRDAVPLGDLMEMLRARAALPRARTAIFLTSDPETGAGRPDAQPQAQQGSAREERHRDGAHRRDPARAESDRVRIETINADFRKVIINYGFMEQPNVPKALGLCRKQGLKFDIMSTSFFLGRRSVVASATSGMPLWQDKLFIFLLKNAANPTDFFHIPAGRVVELGAQVTV